MVRRQGDYAFYIASPMLGALKHWGIPEGDRTILNYGLPEEFQSWSINARCGYMKEMLAQEGHVDTNGAIRWSRSHALSDGNKGPQMGFKSKISQNTLHFLRYSREMHKHRGIVNEQSISMGHIDLLRESKCGLSSIANELFNVIWNYRNRLIDDETKIVRSIGIRISLKPAQISYYKRSDRVSVKWHARIKGNKSKIKSALIIRPNFDAKEAVLDEWLAKQNTDVVNQIRKKLKSDGYSNSE